jgi:hypothetical protein
MSGESVLETLASEAYEWGYGEGQNSPNGYSDKEDRDSCVASLVKGAATIVLPHINPEMFNEDVIFGFEKARNAAKAKLEAMGFKVSP